MVKVPGKRTRTKCRHQNEERRGEISEAEEAPWQPRCKKKILQGSKGGERVCGWTEPARAWGQGLTGGTQTCHSLCVGGRVHGQDAGWGGVGGRHPLPPPGCYDQYTKDILPSHILIPSRLSLAVFVPVCLPQWPASSPLMTIPRASDIP